MIKIQIFLSGKKTNFYLFKFYYELLEIYKSAFESKDSYIQQFEINKKISDDIGTISIIESLFNNRILNKSRTNLFHMKVRRIFC